MPQQSSSVDYDQALLRVIQSVEELGIAAASLSSGTSEPPSSVLQAYQFWADSSAGRTLRQYGDDPANGSRALWTLESGPVALIPVVVTTSPYNVPAALLAEGSTTRTLIEVNSSGGNRTINLPDTGDLTNTLLLIHHRIGGNVVSVVRAGTDTIEREPGDGSETQLDLPNQGDLLGLYTTGDGTWRIWTYRFAGIATAATTKTLTPWERMCMVDSSGGAFTLSLPDPASSPGRSFRVIKTDAGSNVVTVDVDTGENISGSPTHVLATAQYTAATYMSDGAEYYWIP